MHPKKCMVSAGLAEALLLLLLMFGSLSARSQTFQTLYGFQAPPDGNYPEAGLVADSKGALYGTTYGGGSGGWGSVFQLVQQNGVWTENVLHDFTCCGNDGENPQGGVILDKAGNLFGATTQGPNGCGVVYEVSPAGQGKWTETVLHTFTYKVDGCEPFDNLVMDRKGALYGTTGYGGPIGYGMAYKLTPPIKQGGAWKLKILYAFTGQADGRTPESDLVFDKHGALYGTTIYGGPSGQGVVYKLAPPLQKGGAWTETALYSFTSTSDGGLPQSGLVFDKAGNLYGMTRHGGLSSGCIIYSYYCGVVFKLTPKGGSWKETVLHRFTGKGDGAEPVFTSLVLGKKGALYGVTNIGGEPQDCPNQSSGCGVVFKLQPPTQKGGKWKEKVLHTFTNSTDGAMPVGTLLLDAKGNLYGTSIISDGYGGFGTVFEVTP